MFPTLASLVEVDLLDDPDMTCTVIHAYNQWLFDEWPFDYKQRIFTTPVITRVSPSGGGRARMGAGAWCRVVLLRPGPVAGTRGTRSPVSHPPLWRRIEESGVLVAMHASDSGYQRHANEWEGDGRDMTPFAPRPFTDAVNTGRPISDTITSASVTDAQPVPRRPPAERGERREFGSSLPEGDGEDLREDAQGLCRTPAGGLPPEHLHQSVLGGLARSAHRRDDAGPHPLRIHYPHPEGLAEPFEWAAEVSALYPQSDVRKIMGGNMFGLLGLPLPADSRRPVRTTAYSVGATGTGHGGHMARKPKVG